MTGRAAPACVVVVDAFSSGARLPALFGDVGWRAIHVQSHAEIPAHFRSAYPGDDAFAGTVVHRGDIAATASAVRRIATPEALVCGAETGGRLQDILAEALDLPGNDPATNAARTDKFEMHAALARAGLPHVCQIRSTDPDEICRFANTEAGWPIVLKPLDSTGGDGVTFCRAAGDVRQAITDLMGRTNALGHTNAALTAQECLTGTEYVVNGLAHAGHCVISEIWRIQKKVTEAGHSIYDYGLLLEGLGSPQDTLSDYFHQVVSALDLREGAIHAEIMLTSDGPVLIEIAARLAGAISHETTKRALGDSHASLLVRALTDPASFRALPSSGYRRYASAAFVSLINRSAGVLIDAPGLPRVKALSSYVEALRVASPGSRIALTEDLFSGGGLIYLCHEDADALHRDRQTLREIETAGFYRTAADRPSPGAPSGSKPDDPGMRSTP